MYLFPPQGGLDAAGKKGKNINDCFEKFMKPLQKIHIVPFAQRQIKKCTDDGLVNKDLKVTIKYYCDH